MRSKIIAERTAFFNDLLVEVEELWPKIQKITPVFRDVASPREFEDFDWERIEKYSNALLKGVRDPRLIQPLLLLNKKMILYLAEREGGCKMKEDVFYETLNAIATDFCPIQKKSGGEGGELFRPHLQHGKGSITLVPQA